MSKLRVIAVVMAMVVGVRIYQALRPLDLPAGTWVKLKFQVERTVMNTDGSWGIVWRGVWIKIPDDIRVAAGSEVRVVGKLDDQVTDKGGKGKILIWSHFEVLEQNNGLYKAISDFGLWLKQRLLSWLPGDTGALAAGILLGGDTGLGRETAAAFRRSGMTHVLAASGYNVTVVSGIVMAGLAIRLGRRRAIPFGIVCVGLYVLLAGATAAVIRAGIMVCAALAGRYLGKESQAGWMLFLSAWLMLMIKPSWLGDIGFQLSVAATAGILLAERNPQHPGWVSDLVTTIFAQIMTVPLILRYFGSLSVWTPVVNLLVLWCVPWIMEILLAAVAAGLILAPAGQLISWLAWPLLVWMERVTLWAGDWPGNGWQVGQISWWWVGVYYATATSLWWWFKRRRER